MPSRHIVKEMTSESFYHVYNRGVNKSDIFRDADDYFYFLHLFKRYLSNEPSEDIYGRSMPHLKNKIELLGFCLMPNHFHLLVYNIEQQGLVELMRCVMTAYSMYFNKRRKRVGSLFQNTYKASLITHDAYLWHISRYIHLNPQDIGANFVDYAHSSYQYYLGQKEAEWLHSEKIMDLFDSNPRKYASFVKEYEARRKDLQLLKGALANR